MYKSLCGNIVYISIHILEVSKSGLDGLYDKYMFNSHTRKFTVLQCIIQWFLSIFTETNITPSKLRTFVLLPHHQKTPCPLAFSPHSSLSLVLGNH